MCDLNQQIFSNELILSQILSSLSLKELTKSCFLVNHLWLSVSRKLIQNRAQSQHFFELYRLGRHHNSDESTSRENHLSDDKSLSFISDNFEGMETKLLNAFASQLKIRPHLVINFFGNFCPHSKRPERLLNYNGLRKYLPPEAQLLNVTSCSGLIGSHLVTNQTNKQQMYSGFETQAQVGNCAGISSLIIPKYSGVEIDVIDDRNLIALDKLRAATHLKCLLVLSTTCATRTNQYKEFDIINELKQKYDNRIAIGGIIVEGINYFPNNSVRSNKRTRDFFAIAFSGCNVRACSLLFNTLTPESTEREFLKFKQNLDFDINVKTCETIGFLFICTARGVYTDGYNSSNVEASLFSKVFPNIKLLGVYGQGEFGHNYWPSITRQQQLELSESLHQITGDSHELWHFYTSVLVLINLPKK